MIGYKSEDQIRQEIYAALPADLKFLYDGGKAKALIDVFARQLNDYYKVFDENIRMTSLSTATGVYLDFLGRSFGVNRLFNESDEMYRLRIQNNYLTQQTGNSTSVDWLLRSHPRVKDLKYVDYPYGAGSFAIFVIPNTDTIVDEVLLTELDGMLQTVKARGTYAKVLAPTYVPMIISAVINIPMEQDASMLRQTTADAIYRHIWNLDIGETLYIDQLRAIAVNAGVLGISFTSIIIDGKKVLVRDYKIAWDEKLIPDPSLAKPINIL